MSRRRRSYTRASSVVTRNAETGEVLGVEPAYDVEKHTKLIATGTYSTVNPASRARKRRQHIDNERRA